MIAVFWAAVSFVKTWWKFIAAAIVLAPSIFLLGQCRGEGIGRGQMQHALDDANRAALQQKARADDLASRERLTDQRTSDTLERNLANAVANIPDSVPNARRLARACAQLRSQRVDTASLPQCR